ncbi:MULTISPECIES: EAL domain-containing protein [unclassified Shewanella]|uniref:EAL domain-containing protein n=1 Tax=unclassified Shewanella TaxID=196818 RepID=UPI001BC204D7|nr:MULTISPECIES: GGDEF domain-containing protein [unclassified Shewanella]GIU16214.1 diguanylate cyclase [Shewanella sp. MBTL60-112-B1]GIU33717.1 diguanylate cyclase [Shewanella sp. MBTL60-112-B2]
MTTSKLFQLFLVLLFSGLTFLSYLDEKQKLTAQAQQELEQYANNIKQQKNWQGKGESLYDILKQQYNFQFFQYIDTSDSNNNFTQGQLVPTEKAYLTKLFSIQSPHTQALNAGRLQVKLSNLSKVDSTVARFQNALAIIWAIFLLISVTYLLLTIRQKSKIRYISMCVENLAKLSFATIDKSRIKGEFSSVGISLDNSKQLLKAKIDEFQQAHEKLSKTAFHDPITGFGTRALFTEKLNEIGKPERKDTGILVVIRATELGSINQMHGREAGDDYLTRIANDIRSAFNQYPKAQFYRISTADFAIVIADIAIKQATEIADTIKTAFNEYQQQVGTPTIGHTGIVPYQQESDPVSLMTLADTAVSIAQTLGPNCYHIQEKLTGAELFGESRWKVAINDLLRRKAIKFYIQPIRPCRHNVEFYRELLSRFYNSQGKLLPTATVIAMAERHGMSEELDKLIVLNTLRMLIQSPNLDGLIGINISAASATNKSFVSWLKNILSRQRQIAARLVFEVSESGMQANLSATYHFINELHSVGSRISIERFGLGFTSFKLFKEVRPDYIKLDPSYTQEITQDPHNKFFVKMIIDIARKLGIKVIATGVEKQQDKLAMEQLLIDGLQGYYIAEPSPIKQEEKSLNTA